MGLSADCHPAVAKAFPVSKQCAFYGFRTYLLSRQLFHHLVRTYLFHILSVPNQAGADGLFPGALFVLSGDRIGDFNMEALYSSVPGGHDHSRLPATTMDQTGLYRSWITTGPFYLLPEIHERVFDIKLK